MASDNGEPLSEDYLQLRSCLKSTTSLVVNGGHQEFNIKKRKSNHVIARTEDPVVIEKTISSLAFGNDERMDWMTPGSPTLVFLEGRTVLAAVRLLLPGYVRCAEVWEVDAPLIDDKGLVALLVGFGAEWLGEHAGSNEPLAAQARRVRAEFQLSPMSTYRVLRAGGHGYVESKEAVDSSLTAGEEALTEDLRDAAEKAVND